jgi:hypothetical protein
MRSIAAFAVALLIAPVVHAQGNPAELDLKKKMAQESVARIPLEKPVKGAPYSADTIVQASQTLADGNHINRQSTGRVFRDGQGRVRREEDKVFSVRSANGAVTNQMTAITIVDPVGGYSYSLDTEHKIAWRTPMEASNVLLDKVQLAEARLKEEARLREARLKQEGASGPDQNAAAGEAAAKLKAELAARQAAEQKELAARRAAEEKARGEAVGKEPGQIPLEHKTIDGLAVDGHSSTDTIPAGAIGNEQPITITSEEWRSTDLQVLVLTRHNDPRTGESTYRLTNVVRAEPDPSLFMVPPDFTVRDTGIRRNHE